MAIEGVRITYQSACKVQLYADFGEGNHKVKNLILEVLLKKFYNYLRAFFYEPLDSFLAI